MKMALRAAVLMAAIVPFGFSTAAAGEKVVLPLAEVELADEPRERSRGMMEREELCPECAMLFVWPEEAVRSFWMKNTPLALDMIFMDGSGQVVTILDDAEPFRERPSYQSTRPARFVLETPAGFARRVGIAVGDVVDLEKLFGAAVPYRWPKD